MPFYLFRFAELTAIVFLKYSVKVYLMSEVCPTPFVAFGIRQYKCCGGIMVTASHNPKEDNGYKVFWENGAQVSELWQIVIVWIVGINSCKNKY